MIATLPIAPGDRVLDLACGDGAYTGWLADGSAERPGGGGRRRDRRTWGWPARRSDGASGRDGSGSSAADVRRSPMQAGALDLIWCAQSLRSLPDPLGALREMAGLARPGGVVAVLEEDAIHQLILPWPEELELAVRRAELEALAERADGRGSYYAGRRLSQWFRAAGLEEVRVETIAIDRQAPLPAAERAFDRPRARGAAEAGRQPARPRHAGRPRPADRPGVRRLPAVAGPISP